MLHDTRSANLFRRLVGKADIRHRYSCLEPAADPEGVSVDAEGYYSRGQFPGTASRMQIYERHAPVLVRRAVDTLALGAAVKQITHVIVTSCTGVYAPGLDLELVQHLGLNPSVERTMVSFMGCYAAINALKLARHIVRSEPEALVLLVNLELCTLHLQETQDLEQVLSFLVFADGCAASLVSAEPTGLALDSFCAVVIPDTHDLITWRVRELGFDMHLSGKVPGAIGKSLKHASQILGGAAPVEIDLWAVHPGGRSILDAVEEGLGLGKTALDTSRDILARFGNMSSATVMFVLEAVMRAAKPGQRGCAMSFGPGLTAETLLFHQA
jgi:predicted naringenin-chalcone synthase